MFIRKNIYVTFVILLFSMSLISHFLLAEERDCSCSPICNIDPNAPWQDRELVQIDNGDCSCIEGEVHSEWNNGCTEYFTSKYLQTYEDCQYGGIWFPEDPILFRPFVADPRQITYSAGWRFNDNALAKNVIDISFGDTLPIYRWCNVWPWNGQVQIEIQGALWAVFDPLHEKSPLINADYYVGIPVTYAIERWAFRLRAFHISSHIGDEFLIDNPGFDRRNASAEYLDFFVSHDFTEELRLYSGLGFIVTQDSEFKCKRFYADIGLELRLPKLGFVDCKDQLYGCPFYGMHFRARGEHKHHVDATYVAGYEIGKLVGLCRKVRFFVEYHDGYSVEGQFCKKATNYLSIRGSYGF